MRVFLYLLKFLILATTFIIIIIISLPFIAKFSNDPLTNQEFKKAKALIFYDRHHIPLREMLSPKGTKGETVSLEQISPHLINALITAEDKRFFHHKGVDWLAIGNAILMDLKAGRIIRGGSTITQQLARQLKLYPRNFLGKLKEIWLAYRLEAHHTKGEILEEYLNRLPLGFNIIGVSCACRVYFDKSVARISPAEAAFLAIIPRSPSYFNPYKRTKVIIKRRNLLLKRMANIGYLSSEELNRALKEPIDLNHLRNYFLAPHFIYRIIKRYGSKLNKKENIITTLDLELQKKVERIVFFNIEKLKKKGVTNGSVIVVENRTGDVLAYVGSKDFFDETIYGQNDGVLAIRQPGSAVKPLTYALALTKGMTPATLLADIPVNYSIKEGIYRPKNYSHIYHGPVTLRKALANSLNVPAVEVAEKVGIYELLNFYKKMGLKSLTHSPDYYGVGLTLGNGGITLEELTTAYSTLARMGEFIPLRYLMDDPYQKPVRIISKEVAYLIADILSDDQAREISFGRNSLLKLPFPAAAKTGTSSGFRDNWAFGFTPEITVGVWVGNFNGKEMYRVSGITGAVPILREVMKEAMLYRNKSWYKKPKRIKEALICPLSGQRPGLYCPGAVKEYFIEGTIPKTICSFHKGKWINTPDGKRFLEYVEYPAEFKSWAKSVGLLKKENNISSEKKRFTSLPKIQVAYPCSGVRLAIDPTIPSQLQMLPLFLKKSDGIEDVKWFVDKDYIGSSKKINGQFFWKLKPGRHLIYAKVKIKGKELSSLPVKIMVKP